MVDVTLAVSLLELCFAAAAGLVAYFAWHSRGKPAGFPVFILTATACVYAVINGLASLTANEFLTLLLGHLRWPLGAVIAVGSFYTAVEHTNRTKLQRPAVLGMLAGFVVLDFAGFMTNIWHQQLLADVGVENGLFVAANGPFLWVHLVVSFGLAAAGLGLLLMAFNNRGVFRTQTAAIIVGIGIAFGFFVLESLFEIHPAFNIATVGILLGNTVLLWAITSTGLLETVPVARETLVDSMDDFVIALDADDRVIDINEPAREFLDVDGDVLGKPADTVLEEFPELVEQFADTTETNHEFTLERDGERRHYRLSISPITAQSSLANGDGGAFVGRLIVVSDTTEQRRREQDLALLKQVFARVLRHNMRNDLNIIKGNAELLVDSASGELVAPAETVSTTAGDLLTLSEKARDLEAIIESPRTRTRVDLAAAVEGALEEVHDQYPDASIDATLERPCLVMAHQQLETAIKNIVENACEHDTEPPTTIEITTTVHENAVELVITDDGPGIPDHEINVLEAESESSLQHGSGLGLWIINWVINRSEASLDISADSEGTRVALSFERISSEEEHGERPSEQATSRGQGGQATGQTAQPPSSEGK